VLAFATVLAALMMLKPYWVVIGFVADLQRNWIAIDGITI